MVITLLLQVALAIPTTRGISSGIFRAAVTTCCERRGTPPTA